jgi:DNA-directed RNA polymerase specialized sigma24 family protein
LSSGSPKPVTELLVRWQGGDESALQDLIPLVYEELRRLARHYLELEQNHDMLQSTALVHEAYLRLVSRPGDFVNTNPLLRVGVSPAERFC